MGAIRKLKTMVNPDHREINAKYGLQWVEHNALRWLVFSNNWDALPIEQNDRRWNFVENPTKAQSGAYYNHLYDIKNRDKFIAAVWAHLSTLSLEGFNIGERPIENAARKRVLSSLASELEHTLAEFKSRWTAKVADLEKIEAFVKYKMPTQTINRHTLERDISKSKMVICEKRVTKKNVRLVILSEDLNEQQIRDNAGYWVNVADDAAAKFDLDPSSEQQPGTTLLPMPGQVIPINQPR